MVITQVDEAFAEAGLRPPNPPDAFTRLLERRGDWAFTTWPTDTSPFDFLTFVREAITEEATDGLLIAHDGHGVNPWAMHYFAVRGPVAVFVQRAWGGAYADREAESAEVDRAFAAAADILRIAEGDGPLRVVIIDSDISGSFYAVVDGPVAFDDFFRLDWTSEDDVWAAAASALTG
jgi:hypothetical protein